MITKISNSQDTLQALNENYEGLLTGKRKQPLAKEVNNTIGKICNVVKMELIHKQLTADRTKLTWFNMESK